MSGLKIDYMTAQAGREERRKNLHSIVIKIIFDDSLDLF